MTQNTPNWPIKPSLILTLIGLIFAMGGWAYLSDWRVKALEITLTDHSKQKHHYGAGSRLIELETHMIYIREDVGEIKDLIEDLVNRVESRNRREQKNGTSNSSN